MRRNFFLALTLLLAASASALLGQKSAAAAPNTIQVVAVAPGVYQVSVNFSTDEAPVLFTSTAPSSGIAASVTSIFLVSCSHPLGNCTANVHNTDLSGISYNSGAGLQSFDVGSANDIVNLVVSVTLSCSDASSVVIVASQAGSTLTAPLTCGYYNAPYASSLYVSGFGPYGLFPYAYSRFYFAAGCVNVQGQALCGGNPLQALAAGQPTYMPGTVLNGYYRPNIGGAFGAIVGGAGGTERNLTRYAIEQVKQQLPAYLAAYGVDPSLAPLINQYIDYYASVNAGGQRVSAQQIVQQVMLQIATYSAASGGLGGALVPPRTGEAGLVDTDPNLQFPFVTYYDEVPAETGE